MHCTCVRCFYLCYQLISRWNSQFKSGEKAYRQRFKMSASYRPLNSGARIWKQTSLPQNFLSSITFLCLFISLIRQDPALVWMCPPKIHMLESNTSPNKEWWLWIWLDHAYEFFMNSITTLSKETLLYSFVPSIMWDYVRRRYLSTRKPTLNKLWISFILDFLPPELWQMSIYSLLATNSMIFCYSTSNELREFLFLPASPSMPKQSLQAHNTSRDPFHFILYQPPLQNIDSPPSWSLFLVLCHRNPESS